MRDVRVLEMSRSLAGAWCGQLLASTGSDVVMVEPPEGSALRSAGPRFEQGHPDLIGSALHEHLNARKRSAVVDGEHLDQAIGWADIVISSCDGEIGEASQLHERIRSVNPRAVHVVVSGFGLTGPYATWRHSDLVDWASGGYLFITGEPDREPLQGGGPWPSYITGLTAAIGAQAAFLDATCSGEGQLVDVSAMEAVASAHQWSLTMYTHVGVVKGRWGRRFGESYHPMTLYPCRDGWVCVGAPSREQWENFCITIEQVELLADERLYAPAERFERADEIDALATPWLAERSVAEVVAAFQDNRVPASAVLTFADVLDADQLRQRDFWARLDALAPGARAPAAPFRLSTGDVPHRRAPGIGEHTDAFVGQIAHGPPQGRARPAVDLRAVSVVEFGVAWAGPLAARFLADLGADVVKVEHPTARGLGTTGRASQIGGSATWRWGTLPDPQIRSEVFPDADPGPRWWNRMGLWNKMNRNKKSLCLDAKGADGEAVLARLLASADVLLHNYSPRGARSLGLDADAVRRHNPSVVSVAMTGYGETGPMAAHSSYGPILEAYAGCDEATGYLDGEPMRVGLAMPDAIGGLHGAYATLAALWERACVGGPVHVDLSQLETLLATAGESLLWTSVVGRAPTRRGNRSLDFAPQGVYRCRGEDRWLALTVPDDAAWARMVGLIDELGPWADLGSEGRRAAHADIDAALERWTAGHDDRWAASLLQDHGVAACPAFTNADLVEDEHLAQRRFVATWDQTDVGLRRFPGFPVHFERMEIELRTAPALGAHNVEVLQRLGYDESAAAELAARGVIADAPPT